MTNEYWGEKKNSACPLTEVVTWRYLQAKQQEAATALGYNETLWNANSPYSCCTANPIWYLDLVFPKDGAGRQQILYLP